MTVAMTVGCVLGRWGGGVGCERNRRDCMSLCAVCAQRHSQPISVTGVTWEREVFLRTLSEEHAVLALGALTDASGEFFDVIKDLTALGHLGQDLALGVHDGCVITAERLADFGQRKIGELTTQVHRNLS